MLRHQLIVLGRLHGRVRYFRARCMLLSNKIAQKPLALLGDWSVTVGALSASFGH